MFQGTDKIRHLTKKLEILSVLMRDIGRIDQATRKHLSIDCGINYSTLKSECRNESASAEVQCQLVESCGFDQAAPEWIDRSVAPNIHLEAHHDYTGRDSHENFEVYVVRPEQSLSH